MPNHRVRLLEDVPRKRSGAAMSQAGWLLAKGRLAEAPPPSRRRSRSYCLARTDRLTDP